MAPPNRKNTRFQDDKDNQRTIGRRGSAVLIEDVEDMEAGTPGESHPPFLHRKSRAKSIYSTAKNILGHSVREKDMPQKSEIEEVKNNIAEQDADNQALSDKLSKDFLRRVETWSVKDVQYWLDCIGMRPYGSAFRINHINGKVLVSLDEQELRYSLWVKHVGNRKRILEEIDKLRPPPFLHDNWRHALVLTHQSSERTFIMWEKLAVMSLSLSIVVENVYDDWRGLTNALFFVVFGLVVALYGMLRLFLEWRSNKHLPYTLTSFRPNMLLTIILYVFFLLGMISVFAFVQFV